MAKKWPCSWCPLQRSYTVYNNNVLVCDNRKCTVALIINTGSLQCDHSFSAKYTSSLSRMFTHSWLTALFMVTVHDTSVNRPSHNIVKYTVNELSNNLLVQLVPHFDLCLTLTLTGGSLQEHIENQGRLNASTSLQYFRQLLQVLSYLQQKYVLHEDIKADNILLRAESPDLVLADFGLSRQLPPDNPFVAAGKFLINVF